MKIKISDIKINSGRRSTDQQNVEELARSIKAVGLMNPITIDQNHTHIAGLHRMEAAKLLGWTEIECTGTNWANNFYAVKIFMKRSTRKPARA